MASSDRTTSRSAIPRGRHAPPLEVRLGLQRQRLFEAAAAVFAETGYADASAESISRAAGMSKATFYEHFANKEECIIELFDYAWEVLIRRIVQAASAAGENPLTRQREGMRAFLMALVEFPNEAQTLLVEIIGAGPAAARRRDEILERFARVVDRENERMAKTSGSPRFSTPDDAFAIVGAIVELASRQVRLGQPAHPLDLQPVIERFAMGLLGVTQQLPPLPPRAEAAAEPADAAESQPAE